MNQTALFISISTLFISFSGFGLQATRPVDWTVSTQREFLEGKLRGISITSDGKLMMAPALERVFDTEEAFIYAAIADKLGNLYLGTGNEGRIFRITPKGQGTRWAKVDEAGIYALAIDSMDRLYAASSPDGKVYRFDERGKSQVFFDAEEKYIWALAIDTMNNIFVGTGPNGIIYKVTVQGDRSVFYDSRETHIMSFQWDLQGNLLAGTVPGARLFRISPDGTPFVLYDSPLEEIKAITVDRYGQIYAAALGSGKGPAEKAILTTAKSSNAALKIPPVMSNRQATLRVAGALKGAKSVIYKIDRQNLVETLYSSQQELIFDLVMRSDGNLLVATGSKGRILSIDPKRFVALLVESPEEQVTQLLEQEGTIYAATSNLGKLYRLQAQSAKRGVYESKLLDAKMLSSWGLARWRLVPGETDGVMVYSRSGNAQPPDDTWSPWSGPYRKAQGSRIESPPARYLQWKIEFSQSAGPDTVTSGAQAVESVTVTYMQRNMSPKITSITVYPPGLAFIPRPATNPSGRNSPGGPNHAHLRSLPKSIRLLGQTGASTTPRKMYVPGAQSFSWEAEDPNDDDLVYTIYYRTLDETEWKLLGKNLRETRYSIDGVSFADGIYEVKLVVSDSPSNPIKEALENTLICKPFMIANTSPLVQFSDSHLKGESVRLKFTARTNITTVYQTEYSVNGEKWRLIFPRDGIADSEVEDYDLSLEELNSGEHTISVRVVDSVGNIGTGKHQLSIP